MSKFLWGSIAFMAIFIVVGAWRFDFGFFEIFGPVAYIAAAFIALKTRK